MLLPLHLLNLLEVGVPTASVSGTVYPSTTEEQVRAGGETIIIGLSSDTWVAAGATFDAVRQDIIDGLDAAFSPGAGWNVEVRDKMAVTAVVRTDDTTVTITLPVTAEYQILDNEEVAVTVPASALVTSATPLDAGSFDITAEVIRGGTSYADEIPSYRRRQLADDEIIVSIVLAIMETDDG
jgi:hypothetical protein